MTRPAVLVDAWGRVHNQLRVSVTDRCNLRCLYCTGWRPMVFQPRDAVLSFEELIRVIRVAASLGVRRIRFTGGEPLLRKKLPELVARVREIKDVADVALTTNGTMLACFAQELRAAGVQRVNISLDCLSPEKYTHLTGGNIYTVLAGIEAALNANFQELKLNALAIRNFTEDEIVPLTEFARSRRIPIRFIELMRSRASSEVEGLQPLPANAVVRILEGFYGLLTPCDTDPAHPHVSLYRLPDGVGEVGVIAAVTTPFCHRCDRLRLSADGKLRNCLFATKEWDLRSLLRAGASDEEIRAVFVAATATKWFQRPIGENGFPVLPLPMHRVGG